MPDRTCVFIFGQYEDDFDLCACEEEETACDEHVTQPWECCRDDICRVFELPNPDVKNCYGTCRPPCRIVKKKPIDCNPPKKCDCYCKDHDHDHDHGPSNHGHFVLYVAEEANNGRGHNDKMLQGAILGLFEGDNEKYIGISGPDGIIDLGRVADGSYRLKEIKPPTGYAKKDYNEQVFVSNGKIFINGKDYTNKKMYVPYKKI
jgi:hypothetical protein